MHFNLPKPLHGWRAFAGEVGVIMLGVLIALAAQQIAEDWGWRHKVGVVRQSLMGELANDRARWDFDLDQSKCALQQIGPLDSWAGAGGDASNLPRWSANSSNLFTMHATNWTLAANSQTLDHFPMRDQLAFAALYAGLANRQVSIDQASNAIDRVNALIPLAADPEARRELRETLGTLRAAIGSMIDNQGYMQRHFDAIAVKADASDFAADISMSGCGSERLKAG